MDGSGAWDDPYLIYDETDLVQISLDPTANYRLMADIALAFEWEPLPPFTGTLDGNGHKITNIHMNRAGISGHHGFFRELLGDSIVCDLWLETGGSHIIGQPTNYGGVLSGTIAGRASVARCVVKGEINTGGDRTGGVFGYVGGFHNVEEVLELVKITGTDDGRVGHFCGFLAAGVAYNYLKNGYYATGLDSFPVKIYGGMQFHGRTLAQFQDMTNLPLLKSDRWIVDEETGLPKPITRYKEQEDIEIPPDGTIAEIAGTVSIDGMVAQRQIVVISDNPAGRKVVGQGQSAPDGTFSLTYGGWAGSVIALALDQYGSDWTASTAINAGSIVHPTVSNGYVYEASAAGTTGVTEPVWSIDGSVVDGSVTWNPRPYYRPVASGPIKGNVTQLGYTYYETFLLDLNPQHAWLFNETSGDIIDAVTGATSSPSELTDVLRGETGLATSRADEDYSYLFTGGAGRAVLNANDDLIVDGVFTIVMNFKFTDYTQILVNNYFTSSPAGSIPGIGIFYNNLRNGTQATTFNQLGVLYSNGTSNQVVTGYVQIMDNDTHQLVVVGDGTQIHIYLDGQVRTSFTMPATKASGGRPFVLGTWVSGGTNAPRGKIDGIAMFDAFYNSDWVADLYAKFIETPPV